MWDPAEHYWGEENEPDEAWAQEIKARGPRPEYELENVLPGEDPEDFDSDPILEAVELKDADDLTASDQLLQGARFNLIEVCDNAPWTSDDSG